MQTSSGHIRIAAPAADRTRRGVATRVSVVDPGALTEGHLAAWRSFQAESGSLQSPYLTPDFVRIVAEVREGVQVAVYEEGGRIAGFFPFERRGSVGRPVAGALSDCQAVIAAPWWQWDARELVALAGLSVYDFTNQRADQEPFRPFHSQTAISCTIELGSGFDAYVRACRERAREAPGTSSGLPHHTIARMRKVERQLGRLRFTVHDPGAEALGQVIAWKREQYRRTGVPDAFAHRWTRELLERIQATQTEAFSGVLSTLSLDGRIVAAHMGMHSASVLHWWFPGYDANLAKYSPGLILLLELSRYAAGAGIRTIDLSAGEETYKRLVANGGIEVAAGFVGAPSLPLRLRQLRDASVRLAERLPIGPAAQWPGKFFRRLEMLNRYR